MRAWPAIVAVIVATSLLIGCNQSPEPASKVPTAHSAASTLPSPSDATACVDGDIECEERLYQLEETLFAYESLTGQRLHADAQSCWKADVDAFRSRVDACNDFACKEAALLERISTLHDFQPPAQRASFDMPTAPSLIAVLPPNLEENQEAANAGASFEQQGSLVHATEDAEHMGIAVQTGDKQHVFIFEMDMDADPSQDEVLGLVGTSPTTQVLVRGVAQTAPTGVKNFDPSHCRWVFQLPGAQE